MYDVFKDTFTDFPPLLDIGYFANVVDIGNGQGMAIATDGVGTKSLVASMLGVYDTIGIDCVAMNVNDLLCVGARPMAMVDYLSVSRDDPQLTQEIFKGIRAGALEAGVAVVGGETAIVPDLLSYGAFDLSATAIGLVSKDKITDGSAVRPGDKIIGLRSSGIHANGLTEARQALLTNYALFEYLDPLQKTLGEELLTPTRIYVRAVTVLCDAGVDVHAMIHITGGGFLNLKRVAASVGFMLDKLPDAPELFKLIEKCGKYSPGPLYHIFNMGIGFCIVVPSVEVDRTLGLLCIEGESPSVIGTVIADKDRWVYILRRDICVAI